MPSPDAIGGSQAGRSADGISGAHECALKTTFRPDWPPVSGTICAKDKEPSSRHIVKLADFATNGNDEVRQRSPPHTWGNDQANRVPAPIRSTTTMMLARTTTLTVRWRHPGLYQGAWMWIRPEAGVGEHKTLRSNGTE